MTAFETIKQMMVEYPTLFPSKVQAIHHLFWVIGNGYDWVDGELISIDEPHPITPYSISEDHRRMHEEYRKMYEDVAVYDANWEMRERGLIAFSKFLFENDDYIRTYRIELSSIYPLCEHAKVLTVPSDVKPDWLKVAWESVTDVDFVTNFSDDKKETAKRMKWVEQVENHLAEVRKNG